MSTHVPGFSYFSDFLPHFVLAKLATSSTKVNVTTEEINNFMLGSVCCYR